VWFRRMTHRILIADDQPTLRSLLRRELERTGSFEVCGEALDGVDAVAKAERLRPDLIILDLRMPVMNGLEAASVIERVLPSVPIVLFTLTDTPEVKLQAARSGIVQVISKGEGVKALLAAIESALEKEKRTEPPAVTGERSAIADADTQPALPAGAAKNPAESC